MRDACKITDYHTGSKIIPNRKEDIHMPSSVSCGDMSARCAAYESDDDSTADEHERENAQHPLVFTKLDMSSLTGMLTSLLLPS
jgi:hypothetical protein